MPTPVPALATLSGPYWTDGDYCDSCDRAVIGQYWQGGDGTFCVPCVDRARGYEEP